MVLVIDNYDSFTFNLVQYLGDLGADPVVIRNDEWTVEQALDAEPSRVLISPGPGVPGDAGISVSLIRQLPATTPLLGVCLGHQAVGQAFGGRVVRAEAPMHGKLSQVEHDGAGVFKGLPSPFEATRYHSLVLERDSLPDCLEVSAETEDGVVMGVRHRELPIHGVQFHPESIASEHGHALLRNFLAIAGHNG